MAKLLIISGLIILTLGIALYLIPGLFRWFGKLPGDISVSKPGFSLFIPVTSMIIISILITIIINIIKRL